VGEDVVEVDGREGLGGHAVSSMPFAGGCAEESRPEG
jgi:hypothetical protein